MSEELTTEIIETGPIEDANAPLSTEGLAADLSAELAAEEAAKAEAKAAEKAEAKAAKKEASSIDDALEKALAKAQGKEAEPEEKAEAKEEKPKAQRAPDGKFVAPEKEADKAGEQEAEASAQSEGKKVNAPARLLPSERDVWVNTPRAVQGAFERLEKEYEAKLSESKEAVEFRESLRQYDEMAKSANTTVKDALDRYVAMDKAIAANFGQGMASIAQSHGKNPTEAVAQFMRAAGVSPQQLDAYLQGQPAPQQQSQQAQPQNKLELEVQQLKQYIQQQEQARLMAEQKAQEEARCREIEEKIINPLKAEMPRFADLQDSIAKLLQSDIIDRSLSPDVRLREAYFMADRINPALYSANEQAADPDTDSKVTPLPRKKQISGSPSASSAKITPKGPAPSIDDALEAALRRATKR